MSVIRYCAVRASYEKPVWNRPGHTLEKGEKWGALADAPRLLYS
jgi:hypothetical protein